MTLAFASFSNFSCVKFLKTEWEVGIGARDKVLFGTFGVMNCWIHNIAIFFVWAM